MAITPSIVTAKTITIPGDANSIQQAVDLAASGDEILLATDTVMWTYSTVELLGGQIETSEGITIVNKDLIIKGTFQDQKTKITSNAFWYLSDTYRTIRIQNSIVEIYNCILEPKPTYLGRLGAPIEIESGSLVLHQCSYSGMIHSKGNLTIKNCDINNWAHFNGGGYTQFVSDFPTIEINRTSSASLVINNSTVTCDNYPAINNIHILNSTNTKIQIENSILFGGIGTGRTGEGLLINNCNNYDIHIMGSRFIGSHAENLRINRPQQLVHGGNGANGLTITNSNGILNIGNNVNFLKGNNGAVGLVYHNLNTSNYDVINGGNGGHGLAIINSTVQVNFTSFEDAFIASGGKGGEGAEYDGRVALPGKDGLPIFIDENSTIIYPTHINNWMVY